MGKSLLLFFINWLSPHPRGMLSTFELVIG